MLIVPLINSFSQDVIKLMLNTEKSFIEYESKHFLHEWTGKNNKIKGVIFINNEEGKIALVANIVDFDSGISNRDSNALRVLDAFKHPQVRFYSDQIIISDNTISFDGELEFHGIKVNKRLDASYFEEVKTINIEGNFSIVLTDFDIKLPSLMLKKIDDFAKISYKLIFEKI